MFSTFARARRGLPIRPHCSSPWVTRRWRSIRTCGGYPVSCSRRGGEPPPGDTVKLGGTGRIFAKTPTGSIPDDRYCEWFSIILLSHSRLGVRRVEDYSSCEASKWQYPMLADAIVVVHFL